MKAKQLNQHLMRGAELGVFDVVKHQSVERTEKGARLVRDDSSDVTGLTFTVLQDKSILLLLPGTETIHMIEGDKLQLHTTNRGNVTGLAVFLESVDEKRIDRNIMLRLEDVRRMSFSGAV